MHVKAKILKLHQEGKSYRDIEKILKCSRSLISYYVSPTTKDKTIRRQSRNRYQIKQDIKTKAGGRCCICGYSRCFDALEFHHKDRKTKEFDISDAVWTRIKHHPEELQKELDKCLLLCANCHRELHAGLISI